MYSGKCNQCPPSQTQLAQQVCGTESSEDIARSGANAVWTTLRAVCCVCLCFLGLCILRSLPSIIANGEAGRSLPQAGTHLPSLTCLQPTKLLLQERGGENNESSAESRGGQVGVSWNQTH